MEALMSRPQAAVCITSSNISLSKQTVCMSPESSSRAGATELGWEALQSYMAKGVDAGGEENWSE